MSGKRTTSSSFTLKTVEEATLSPQLVKKTGKVRQGFDRNKQQQSDIMDLMEQMAFDPASIGSEALDISDVVRETPTWALRFLFSQREQRADERNRVLNMQLVKEQRLIDIKRHRAIEQLRREERIVEHQKRRIEQALRLPLERRAHKLERQLNVPL